MLDVRNLTVAISSEAGELRPVDGVSFSVADGECFALVGESGCGKSMTALALMRLLPDAARIVSGEVHAAGADLMRLPESEMQKRRGSGIAMIFQEHATSLNPVMTVGEQIVEALMLHKPFTHAEARREACRWLERVGIDEPERRMNAFPFELSGGQKQRVMIAMMLANDPEVVIADEPTTALDVTLQAQIIDLLRRMQKERRLSLVLITHDLALVQSCADRVALMYAGQIVEEAKAADFFASPAHPYAGALLAAVPKKDAASRCLPSIAGHVPALSEMPAGCRFAPRCPKASPACAHPVELTDRGEGRRVRCLMPGASSVPAAAESACRPLGEPVLEVENLRVVYEKSRGLFRTPERFEAVRGVSLTVRAGETLALVGESGSGKSTTALGLLGLLPEARVSGAVRICGMDAMHPRADRMALKRAAQIIFQDPFASLDPRMSVGESIEEGLAALRPDMDRAARRARVAELLVKVGLAEAAASRLPHEFSGGQRQRVAIARALAVSPRLIVCDEPTSALDVSVQAQILNLMRRIQAEEQVGFLFITHNFAVVEYLADSVAVLRRGELVESGTAREVLEHPKHAYTQSLLAVVPRLVLS